MDNKYVYIFDSKTIYVYIFVLSLHDIYKEFANQVGIIPMYTFIDDQCSNVIIASFPMSKIYISLVTMQRYKF